MSQVKDTSAKSSMVQKMKYRKVKSKAEEINSAEKHVSDMFSFENFWDISLHRSSKKCTMDLTQFVSDQELEDMKNNLLSDYYKQ